MLKIPDEISIQLVDKGGKPFQVGNVVIGIQTFAVRKNDIHIFPFYTNADGQVRITKKEISEAADKFVGFGLMDYASLESAKPKVEIHIWANEEIEKYIAHWEPILQRTNYFDNSEKNTLEKLKISNNKKISGLITDDWDGKHSKYFYELKVIDGA